MIFKKNIRLNKSDFFFFLNNIKDYLSFGDSKVSIWYFTKIKNVGDLVGPYIISSITKKPIRKNILGVGKHYLSAGSILEQATKSSIVWGSGLISSTQNVPDFLQNVSLVRGYLTKNRILNGELDNEIAVGDPALALPRFYIPSASKKFKVGIIPHYVDFDDVTNSNQDDNIRVIDVRQDVEDFIDDLVSCEYIFSSSLHGLIIADTYGVPNKWVKLSNKLDGDDFKFYDYYSVYPKREVSPLTLGGDNSHDFNGYLELCSYQQDDILVDNILRSFNYD
jgi:pyruvyltransferase